MGCLILNETYYQNPLKVVYKGKPKASREAKSELMWLSVDPLSIFKADGQMLPYSYVRNNPVRYIDPNGLWEEDKSGDLKAVKGDSAGSLAKHLGIGQKAAEQRLADQGYGTRDNGNTDIHPGDVYKTGGGNSSGSGGSGNEQPSTRDEVVATLNYERGGSADGTTRGINSNENSKTINAISFSQKTTETVLDGFEAALESGGNVLEGNLKWFKRGTSIVGYTLDGASIANASYKDGWTLGPNAQVATAEVVGSASGSVIGYWAGFTIGSLSGFICGPCAPPIAKGVGILGGLTGAYIGGEHFKNKAKAK